MIDILAGFSLAGAAATKESPIQLIADAELLYGLYVKSKAGTLNIHTIDLKPTIAAAARLTAVANALSEDPAQLKNITELLASLP
jgi:hypothetical protein